MRKFWTLIFLCLGSFALMAQGDTSLIRIESHWYGQSFIHGASKISMGDLIDISEGDSRSNELFRKANNRHDFARFSQIAGTFLVLYPFVNEAIGRDPNYNMVYIGASLWALSIPVELSARRTAIEATMLYNKRKQSQAVKLEINPLQLRLSLRF